VVLLALWIIGIGQAVSNGGSWLLAASASVVGVLLVIIGMTQASLLAGAFHWVIQVVHLLLGMLELRIALRVEVLQQHLTGPPPRDRRDDWLNRSAHLLGE